jgi:hypothetical protein
MKGLERKRQILAQIIVGREAEMAETSKGKHNDDCLKNYLSGRGANCRQLTKVELNPRKIVHLAIAISSCLKRSSQR